jgi:hypothetical protein
MHPLKKGMPTGNNIAHNDGHSSWKKFNGPPGGPPPHRNMAGDGRQLPFFQNYFTENFFGGKIRFHLSARQLCRTLFFHWMFEVGNPMLFL